MAGETAVLGESMSLCHFAHHKTCMTIWDRSTAAAAEKWRQTAWVVGNVAGWHSHLVRQKEKKGRKEKETCTRKSAALYELGALC